MCDEAATKLYKAQIASCERGNASRRESNRRAKLHKAQDEAIQLVAETARDARLSDYQGEGRKQKDLNFANRYQKAVNLVKNIEFKNSVIENCYDIIPKPRFIE